MNGPDPRPPVDPRAPVDPPAPVDPRTAPPRSAYGRPPQPYPGPQHQAPPHGSPARPTGAYGQPAGPGGPPAPPQPSGRRAAPFQSAPFEPTPYLPSPHETGTYGNGTYDSNAYRTETFTTAAYDTGPIQTAFESGPFGAAGTFPRAGGALDPDDRVEAFAPRESTPDQPESDDHHSLVSFRKIRSHAKHRRVPMWAVFAMVLGVVAVGAGLRFVPGSPFAAGTEPETVTAEVPMPLHSAAFTVADLGTDGFLSWAYLDRRDGTIVGSENLTATSDTASMIKVWLASDYLRRSAERGETPPATDLTDLEAMIRDSDNAAAERVVVILGGAAATVSRLATMCQLTEAQVAPDGIWGKTVISARDAVRMGGCVADGRAAGAQWTPWVLDMMRQVRGEGDFGIRKAFPVVQQSSIAIKNGWALRAEDGTVHANCLAIGPTWVLAVLQRYPSHGDFGSDMAHVDGVCQDVARKLTAAA